MRLPRNRLEFIKENIPKFKYDPVSFNKLLVAPFKPRNIFQPITGGLVLIALGELYVQGRTAKDYFGQVNKMYFMNSYIDKNPAMAIYGATSLASSYGAGIGEEYYLQKRVPAIVVL